MSKLCVVTVVDSIAATSMPINEFVIYRDVHNYPMRQVLLVLDKNVPENVKFSERIEVHLTGSDKGMIKALVKQLQSDCLVNGEKIVYHMHAQKSAINFLLATIGMGVWNKSLFTVHSTYADRDLKYKITSCFCSLAAKCANCVSHSAYKQYNGLVKKWKGPRIMGIPNGVDFVRIDKSLEGLPTHTSVCDIRKWACVGRIIPIKNQKFLIDLLAKAPDAELTLIGAEDKAYDIKAYAKEKGVADRVFFTGLMARDEVFRRLNECGLYVSSSTVEGLPVSVLEAMSVGLIPAISDIDSHVEIAKTCGLFNAMELDQEIWLRNYNAFKELGKDQTDTMSRMIRNSVKEHYSLEKMHEQYMNIYKQLTK